MEALDSYMLLEQRRALDEAAIVSEADLNGNIIFVNNKFVEISGYSREELIGQNHRVLNSHTHNAQFFANMWRTISQGNIWHGDVCNRAKNGRIYWVKSTIVPILDPQTHKPIRYQSIRFEITKHKQLEQELKQKIRHDALTGVFNREAAQAQFKSHKQQADQKHQKLAICLLDLNKFKQVNDHYGHEIGDKLLIEVAKRLSQNMREQGVVFRLGGDEFALILSGVMDHKNLSCHIEHILFVLKEPYLIDSHIIASSASIGVALYPDSGDDIDSLLRNADQAMYQAKLESNRGYFIFDASLRREQDKQLQLIREIERALARNDFQLYYQPKVNLTTGSIIGMEALLRWIHPAKGLVSPSEFLTAIENHRLMIDIDNWVLKAAVEQLDLWQANNITWTLSVNISSLSLQQKSFVNDLQVMLTTYPKKLTHCLEIEILENVVLNDINQVKHTIQQLQQSMGVHFSLDDFGTGYSSLSYLKQLPIGTIKIDKSFVRDILDDESDRTIIEAIVMIGKTFKCKLIAEGVENVEQASTLLALGCEQIQGYWIAKPMPSDQVTEWANSYNELDIVNHFNG